MKNCGVPFAEGSKECILCAIPGFLRRDVPPYLSLRGGEADVAIRLSPEQRRPLTSGGTAWRAGPPPPSLSPPPPRLFQFRTPHSEFRICFGISFTPQRSAAAFGPCAPCTRLQTRSKCRSPCRSSRSREPSIRIPPFSVPVYAFSCAPAYARTCKAVKTVP